MQITLLTVYIAEAYTVLPNVGACDATCPTDLLLMIMDLPSLDLYV